MRMPILRILPACLVSASAHASQEDSIRETVAEVLADAESRTPRIQSISPAKNAGHAGAFFLSDSDGDFSLKLKGQIKFRYFANFHNASPDSDTFEPGFASRRTKITAAGHALSPELSYKLTFAFSRSSGAAELETAYARHKLDDRWTLRFGQDRLRFLREEHISGTSQLAADRSLTNAVFNQGFSQFAELSYANENTRIYLAISDGLRSHDTPFNSHQTPSSFSGAASGGEADFAMTSRVEYKAASAWKRFDDFTSPNGNNFGALFAAAIHYESGDTSTTSFARSYSLLTWTADASFEGNGWSAYAAAIGAHSRNGSNSSDTDDYGFVVQGAAYLTATDTECFARYDIILPDNSRATGDPFDTLTLGINHYFHGHAAKFTADVQVFLGDTNALSGPNTCVGYLASNEHNEIALRIQFQLLF